LLRRLTRGLSLAELLLAFALLTTVALVITALFLRLLQGGGKRADLTVGRAFAQATLEEVVRSGLYATSTSELASGLYSHDAGSQTTFFYQVTSSSAPCPPPSSKRGYLFEVEVWWWNAAANQTRANMGLTSTRLSRWIVP
jgi:hypothetical protein